MEHTFDVGTRTHRWAFGGSLPDVVFVVADAVTQDAPNGVTYLCDAAMIHGFKQKIGDAGAIPFAKNKRYATDAEKREAMQQVVDRLNAGQWNADRTGPKERKPILVNVDALVAAIAATLKRNVIGVRAFVEGKTESGRADLAGSEQFAQAYAIALAQQRPVTKLDDATAAELDAIPAE